jgi:hypothetical protein
MAMGVAKNLLPLGTWGQIWTNPVRFDAKDNARSPGTYYTQSILAGILALAVRHGTMSANPVREIEIIGNPGPKTPRSISNEEREQWFELLNQTSGRFKRISSMKYRFLTSSRSPTYEYGPVRSAKALRKPAAPRGHRVQEVSGSGGGSAGSEMGRTCTRVPVKAAWWTRSVTPAASVTVGSAASCLGG